jgi:Spy/CpxP family protein refolding chaperone
MEKLMNKTRILLWAVIALVLFNIATIVTILWQNNNGNRAFHRDHVMMMPPSPRMMGQMMKDKLQLKDKQIVAFDSIENIFKLKSLTIFTKMKRLRGEMVEVITSENPDSAKLISLTKQLGDLHIDLKMNTFSFYFGMKKVCEPNQQKELSNIFRGMFQFEGMPEPRGREMGRRGKMQPNYERPPREVEFEGDDPNDRMPRHEGKAGGAERQHPDCPKPAHNK